MFAPKTPAASPPQGGVAGLGAARRPAVLPSLSTRAQPVWFFDLDNTLHNAGDWVFGQINQAMTDYVGATAGLAPPQADQLRRHYWSRYGATLLGLVRHHGVSGAHFLHHTHQLPGLEARVRSHAHDVAALARLRGRKFVLTNAPREYARRVLGALGLLGRFDGVIAIEDMRMFGHWRPKPDRRMLRNVAARLGAPLHRCVLVEDTLEHQKAARSLGMHTVWMQRWLQPSADRRLCRKPPYVCDRIHELVELSRLSLLPRCR